MISSTSATSIAAVTGSTSTSGISARSSTGKSSEATSGRRAGASGWLSPLRSFGKSASSVMSSSPFVHGIFGRAMAGSLMRARRSIKDGASSSPAHADAGTEGAARGTEAPSWRSKR
jgi:hypothetical protein